MAMNSIPAPVRPANPMYRAPRAAGGGLYNGHGTPRAKQRWAVDQIVNVGFIKGLVVKARVLTPGRWPPGHLGAVAAVHQPFLPVPAAPWPVARRQPRRSDGGLTVALSKTTARAVETARLHLRYGNPGGYARSLAGEHRATNPRQQRAIEAVIAADAMERLFIRHPGNGCLMAQEA